MTWTSWLTIVVAVLVVANIALSVMLMAVVGKVIIVQRALEKAVGGALEQVEKEFIADRIRIGIIEKFLVKSYGLNIPDISSPSDPNLKN